MAERLQAGGSRYFHFELLFWRDQDEEGEHQRDGQWQFRCVGDEFSEARLE